MTTTSRHCYHADESFQDSGTGHFNLVRIVEGESGYNVVRAYPTLDEARAQAASANAALGLTDQDVLDIRTSSMAQHFTEHPDRQ